MKKKPLFRFAVQTPTKRLSEVWNFSRHKKDSCLFADRTSQRGWWKISFHESGQCHIKTYSDKDGTIESRWTYPALVGVEPVHVMRIIYDMKKQSAEFEFDERIGVFENWGRAPGSVYLDVYFVLSDTPIEVGEVTNIAAAHNLGERKWVFFRIVVGPPQPELLEDMFSGDAGGSMHIGEYVTDANGKVISLRNFTAIFYKIPDQVGTLLVIEKSDDNFLLPTPPEDDDQAP